MRAELSGNALKHCVYCVSGRHLILRMCYNTGGFINEIKPKNQEL